MSRLMLARVQLREANSFVGVVHRHHGPVRGHGFSIGAARDAQLVGVVIAGRPVSRGWDFRAIAEITRLATDGTPNACSFLYGAARRAALAMGYRSVITYTLASEPGASLRAAGFRFVHVVPGRSWSCRSRPRTDKHPTADKHLWASGDLLPMERAA